MLALSLFKRTAVAAPQQAASDAKPASPVLENLLEQMCAFGKPVVGVYSSGWHCKVEMTVPLVGTSFDVRSEFGHATALAATLECWDRVQAVVKQWGKARA